jgi:hypothetical protein
LKDPWIIDSLLAGGSHRVWRGEAAEIIGGPYNAGRMPVPAMMVRIAPPSSMVMAVLAAILSASLGIFLALVRRETIRRRHLALSLWAASQQMRIIDPTSQAAVEAIGPLAAFNPKIETLIGSERLALAQLRTEDSKSESIGPASGATRWNLLIRPLDQTWPATALRPTANTKSIADLFGLSSFPSLAMTPRFVVFGAESPPARKLARLSAAAAIPADIGVLVCGQRLVLDFTARPFDEIEFGRMIVLVEQLLPHLT